MPCWYNNVNVNIHIYLRGGLGLHMTKQLQLQIRVHQVQKSNLRVPAEQRVSRVTRQKKKINAGLLTLGTNQWLENTDGIPDTSTHKCTSTHTQMDLAHDIPIGLWLTPAWWSAGEVTWYLPENAGSMASKSQTQNAAAQWCQITT